MPKKKSPGPRKKKVKKYPSRHKSSLIREGIVGKAYGTPTVKKRKKKKKNPMSFTKALTTGRMREYGRRSAADKSNLSILESSIVHGPRVTKKALKKMFGKKF